MILKNQEPTEKIFTVWETLMASARKDPTDKPENGILQVTSVRKTVKSLG